MGCCFKKPDISNSIMNLDVTSNKNKANDLFINEAIKYHEILRANHMAPPLIYSEQLSKFSQKWAENLAQTGNIRHSNLIDNNGREIGENIAILYNSKVTGKFMTMLWYNENVNYDFNDPGFNTGTANFTQLVWKDSKEIGIGLAKCRNGEYIAVANYYPAGNIDESYTENVLPHL